MDIILVTCDYVGVLGEKSDESVDVTNATVTEHPASGIM